jgi:hypothetical protein
VGASAVGWAHAENAEKEIAMSFGWLGGLLVSLLASAAVIAFLRRPMRRLLNELCGTPERAGFWQAYADLILVLVPLATTLFAVPGAGEDVLAAAWVGARWATVGLVVSLVVIGSVLARFVADAPRPTDALGAR